MSQSSEPSLAQPEVQECPWTYYQDKHPEGFFWDEQLGMFICMNYQLMREILRDPDLYSNVNSQNVSHMRTPPEEVREIQARSPRVYEILVSADPPNHGRVRKLVDDPFRPRAIESWRTHVQDIVNGCIESFIHQGETEIVESFAIPIPVTVIADILGIDRSHAPTIKVWSDASVEPLGMMITDERWIECAHIIEKFQHFMIEQIEIRQTDPREDLLTHLVQARDEQGEPLTMGEMLAVVQQILVAGNETTTNGIAAGVQLLAENQDQQAQLRANPDRMYTFVNEALRLESPVQGLFRIVTRDTEINGLQVPKGSRIHVRYAAANRDGAKYDSPDEVDIFRQNAGTQVGFGAGIHHCLGANLAREEMFQAFTMLLDRTNNIRLKPDANEFKHHPSMILRGLESLWVEFE